MLAAQAMTTVFGEVTYPVMGMIKWHRTYFSMIATPLSVGDIVAGATSASCCSGSATVAPSSSLVMAPFGVFDVLVGRAASRSSCSC